MKVKELLADPNNWNKGSWARNAAGDYVRGDDPAAVRWCLQGAIWKCYAPTNNQGQITEKVMVELGMKPAEWNDMPERTHSEVLTLARKLDI